MDAPSTGAAPLVRASGLELLGEVPGSGYREPPALVRRGDGQTIQLTKLLYLVLAAVDGVRTEAEVAEVVSASAGRLVTADNVRTLSGRLRALGLLRRDDGSERELRRADPLLGLRFRYVVSDPAVTNRLTAPFAVLFAPVVVAAVTLAFLGVCAWVLLEKGLASATHQAFDRPGLLLGVFLLTVVSAGFHEFGHAAAARYGGATPGAMGAGLYLVWPAFYTDVTDSYRLGRAGRVRTDLGGLYFNAIVAVVMFGAWWGSQWDALLLIIATQVLQMLRQLAPLVRFDGYHILADVTGVPDLYHRIGPTLLSLLPGRWHSAQARDLKPWARAVVTTWVLLVVPVLLAALVLTVLALPRLVGTAAASLQDQVTLLGEQLGAGDGAGVTVRALSVVAIALPVLGVFVIVSRVVAQVARRTWRATQGRPAQRSLAGLVALGLIGALAWAWWPHPGAYRPIQAYERGVVQDSLPASLRSASPTGLLEGGGGTGQAIWPAGGALPTAEAPVLAIVLVPREGPSDGAAPTPPTWVFPFDRPLPPGAGDNQALAVNTTDGGTLYDVAFALVWAEGDTVLNTNEAYALASCTGCQTVAVAFQVVLVIGEADVVVPQNLSAAVNYACVQCVTYALATQLVVSVPEQLSPEAMAELEALWREIAAFGEAIEGVPLSQIQERLTAFEAEILRIVRGEATAATDLDADAATGTATGTEPAPGEAVTSSPSSTTAEPGSDPSPSQDPTPTTTSVSPGASTTEEPAPADPETLATETSTP